MCNRHLPEECNAVRHDIVNSFGSELFSIVPFLDLSNRFLGITFWSCRGIAEFHFNYDALVRIIGIYEDI